MRRGVTRLVHRISYGHGSCSRVLSWKLHDCPVRFPELIVLTPGAELSLYAVKSCNGDFRIIAVVSCNRGEDYRRQWVSRYKIACD